eukprot:maker-scaffold631_size122145-snap-gene-0.48 protein:Tk01067 transcript:maker-scaffold631_size122145-snap-gene-0.48-mRNA-1 annotation:"ccna_patvu ame: full"
MAGSMIPISWAAKILSGLCLKSITEMKPASQTALRRFKAKARSSARIHPPGSEEVALKEITELLPHFVVVVIQKHLETDRRKSGGGQVLDRLVAIKPDDDLTPHSHGPVERREATITPSLKNREPEARPEERITFIMTPNFTLLLHFFYEGDPLVMDLQRVCTRSKGRVPLGQIQPKDPGHAQAPKMPSLQNSSKTHLNGCSPVKKIKIMTGNAQDENTMPPSIVFDPNVHQSQANSQPPAKAVRTEAKSGVARIPPLRSSLPHKVDLSTSPVMGQPQRRRKARCGYTPFASSRCLTLDEDESEDFSSNTDMDTSAVFALAEAQNEESMEMLDSPEDLDLKLLPPTDDNSSGPVERTKNMLDFDEYLDDIYAHLRKAEMMDVAECGYMDKQVDISFVMRTILVDWLVEVGEEYKLNQETIYLAVNYIDRFLSCMAVQRAKLQLVGTACLFLASKYEEICPPDVGDFVYIADDTYSKGQVLRMEQMVMKVLRFNLAIPTSLIFVNLFATQVDSDDETRCLAQYLSELTLLDARIYLGYRSSVIGAAALSLARHTQGLMPWTDEISKRSGMERDDIKECLAHLYTTFAEAPGDAHQAIRHKYGQAKFHGVSQNEPLPNIF